MPSKLKVSHVDTNDKSMLSAFPGLFLGRGQAGEMQAIVAST
jgi:hypothetical protein